MLEKDISKEEYAELMKSLASMRQEQDKIRHSKQYKVGSFVIRMIDCVAKFKIKSMAAYIRYRKAQSYFEKHAVVRKPDKTQIAPEEFFSQERIAVYTSVFGEYDTVQEPVFQPSNIDYYIITDRDVPETSKWKKIEFKNATDTPLSNAEKNRYCKMHPDQFFGQDYRYSIYLDGNIKVISDVTPMIHRIGESGLAFHAHPYRDCTYDELEACVMAGKISKKTANEYRQYLLSKGMPEHYGLLECGVIAREHNNPKCKSVMESWWTEFHNNIHRDQVSMPYVLFTNDIAISDVDRLGIGVMNNCLIQLNGHG